MAIGQISYASIVDYCQYHSIDGEQRDDVVYHMRAMDATYMEFHAKKNRPPK